VLALFESHLSLRLNALAQLFNCVYISVPELYPTRYRATMLGIASASARFGSMAASYIPYVLGGSGTLIIVSMVCFVGAFVSVMAVPETLGKPFPTTLPRPPVVTQVENEIPLHPPPRGGSAPQ
jgi:hypothetical protein